MFQIEIRVLLVSPLYVNMKQAHNCSASHFDKIDRGRDYEVRSVSLANPFPEERPRP